MNKFLLASDNNLNTFPLAPSSLNSNKNKQPLNLNDYDKNVKNKIILSFYIIVFFVLFTHPVFVKVFVFLFSNISNQSISNDDLSLNIFGQFIISCIFSILILILV